MSRNLKKHYCGYAMILCTLFFAKVVLAEEVDELVLEVVSQGGGRLGEPIIALQTDSGVYLPVQDTGKLLGVRIEQPQSDELLVYTTLDKYVSINSESCKQSKSSVVCASLLQHDGLIYFKSEAMISELLWPITVDENNMRLVVARSAKELGRESFRKEASLRPLVIQRDMLGYPTFRAEVDYAGPPDRWGSALYSMQSLGGHDSEMQYFRYRDENTFRWSLGKELYPEDERGLSPKQYSLGSIQSYDLKYISPPLNATGARVSNRRIDSNLFETRNIYERGPPRWRVELFINGTYFGESVVGVDGIFTFENTPIFYGSNSLLFRFTSPIGQTYEFSKEYNVQSDFEGRGVVSYQASYGQVENSASNVGSVQVGYGLSSNISLNAGFIDVPWKKHSTQYSVYGITLMEDIYSVGVSSVEEMDAKGRLWAVTPKLNWKGFLFSSEYARFEDFVSQKVNRTREGQISSLNTSLLKRLDFSVPIVTQLLFEKDEFESRSAFTKVGFRGYSMLGGRSLLLELEKSWQLGSSSDVYLEYGDYNKALRGKYGVLLRNGQNPTARISLEKSFVGNLYLSSSFDLTETSERNSYTLGLSKLFSQILMEARVSYYAEETVYGLSLSSNFRVSPTGIEVSSQEGFQMGRIELQAFVDENGDGIRNANEKGLKGLRILHVQRQKEYETDESGQVLLKSVSPYQRITFEVVRESVTNVYLTPSDLQHDVAVTPGQSLVVRIPVGPTFDVRGALQNPHFKKLVPMELCTDQGEVVARTTTSATGKFRFDDVKAGEYLVRVNDQFLRENGLNMVKYSRAHASGAPGVIVVETVVLSLL